MDKFYGCYMGSYEKMYRWQCKSFPTEQEATRFALDGSNNEGSKLTFLLEINPMTPRILHSYMISNSISDLIAKVDIVDK